MPKKSKGSSVFPVSSPKAVSTQEKFSLKELEAELQQAQESGDYDRVIALLDTAPKWMRNQPEFMITRAYTLLSAGEEKEARELLHTIAKKYPHLTEVHALLAMLYMDMEMPAHAIQFAKRAIADRQLPEEMRQSLDEIFQEATSELQDLAKELGVSQSTMQQCSFFHEKALLAMKEQRHFEADQNIQKAIDLIPTWNPLHNNRARMRYFNGKTSEAIAISEAVLTRDEKDFYALHSLVMFHYGLDQLEQARSYASRLAALAPQLPLDSMDMDQVISALALVEDTSALWKIAKKYLGLPADVLYGRSWHCLAVAAVRMGKWKNALDLMNQAQTINDLSPAAEEFTKQLRVARRLQPPRLDWMPPEYPGAELLFDPKIVHHLESLLKDSSDPMSSAQQKRLERFFQQYPFMKTALRRLLQGESTSSFAANTMVHLNQPDMDTELLDFALSQIGSREARMNALLALVQAERYAGSKTIKIWDEELRQWNEVALNTQRIGSISIKALPQTLSFIEKAHRTKNPDEAITLLRKAVELEPTCAMALFNLGVVLTQNGNEKEGKALILQSVVVDPTYTYGHASIALAEIESGSKQAALEHLQYVTQAEVIAPETAVIANLAWCMIALHNRDLKGAREHFDLAAHINPDHRLLEDYRKHLESAEKFGFILNFQRETAIRAHRKLLNFPLKDDLGLRACLETYTKDMLVASAHFLQISPSGKKAELASRLAECLIDPEFLRTTLDEDINEKEKEALRWILDAGGVRSWLDLVKKYGDDMQESTFWTFHEPESIPGRLRMSGLLFSGTLEESQVAFIPADLRTLLMELL
jgi:tetratricopeptide (TPR) repeat protein